jgi:hypothetical protein
MLSHKQLLLLYGALTVSATAVLLLISAKKRRVRRFKVRPMNRTRDAHGSYASLVRSMKICDVLGIGTRWRRI